jgi:hypothetical protein
VHVCISVDLMITPIVAPFSLEDSRLIYDMLRSATVDKKTKVMKFETKKLKFDTLKQLFPTLYLRDCWDEIYERFQTCRERGSHDGVITGTPGIGKSHFMRYWVTRSAKEDTPIVWEFASGKFHYFSRNEVLLNVPENDLYTKLFEDETKFGHFVDIKEIAEPSESIMDLSSFTLVFSSPDERRFHEMLKDKRGSSCRFAMDPYSEEEVWDAYEAMDEYKAIPRGKVEANMAVAGSIPRLIYSNNSAEDKIIEAVGSKGQHVADTFDQKFTPLDDKVSPKLIQIWAKRRWLH